MAAAFGVHFGGTSACLAVFKDGKTDVVANDAGDRVTPAVVAFTDHDQSVGLAAKQGIIRNAANTVTSAKLLLGRSFDDSEVQQVVSSSTVKIVNKDGKPVYEVEYKEKTAHFSAQQIATTILKTLLEIAERHGEGNGNHDAVLTVPIHFNEKQKTALRTAAKNAGFNVLRLISEPSAAALAYDISQKTQHESSNLLVYRLGGTSLDVTVITANSGMYRILSSVSCQSVGGQNFTDQLVQYFASEFQRQWRNDCNTNKRSIIKLRSASETCKHVLSNMQTAHCSVESLYDGIDYQGSIARGRFEGLCGSLVQSCLKPLEEILEKAGLQKDDINKVILCGGSTKIPCLQQQVRDYFPQAELVTGIVPDEVIAIGAAKQAAILVGSEQEELSQNEVETEVPCLPRSIIVETVQQEGAQYCTALSKCTPVPVRRTKSFSLEAEQTSFLLKILADGEGGSQPVSLATLTMTDLPAGCKVDTVFHVRSDGSMHVTCTEPTTSKTQDITIEAS